MRRKYLVTVQEKPQEESLRRMNSRVWPVTAFRECFTSIGAGRYIAKSRRRTPKGVVRRITVSELP